MKKKITFYPLKMEFPTADGETSRYYHELMYAEYDNPYCRLHFADNSTFPVETGLGHLLANLPQKPFFKCNRTTVANICYYKEYRKKKLLLVMDDGREFTISTRNIAGFKQKKKLLPRISPLCPGCGACRKSDCPDLLMFCDNGGQADG